MWPILSVRSTPTILPFHNTLAASLPPHSSTMVSATWCVRFDRLAFATALPMRQDWLMVCSTTHLFVSAPVTGASAQATCDPIWLSDERMIFSTCRSEVALVTRTCDFISWCVHSRTRKKTHHIPIPVCNSHGRPDDIPLLEDDWRRLPFCRVSSTHFRHLLSAHQFLLVSKG
jgi:hypothetical protein